MIVIFYALIILGLAHCDHLPSRFEIERSINRTIDEVEKLIGQNSSLPRLTRREIVDILFNITSKDLEIHKNQETVEEARRLYQRALMVVLPYKAEDAKENIRDLYTKPPIVKIIDDPSSDLNDFKTYNTEKLKLDMLDKQPLENLVVTHVLEKSSPKDGPLAKTRYKNHRETYSEIRTKIPLKETLKFDSAPIKFSFNLENLQKQSTPITERPVTTKLPVFQEVSPSKNEEVHIIYSTSATTSRTTDTSSTDVQDDLKNLQTPYPLKHKQNVLSSDQWHYNAPPITTDRSTTSKVPLSTPKRIRGKQPFLPTVKVSTEDTLTPTAISKIESTAATTNTERSGPIYVTPMSSSSSSSSPSSSSEKSKYTSTYNLNSGGFRRIVTTMRPEVMDLLASIGLRPENTTNVEEVFKKNKENLKTNSQIPNSNGIVGTTTGLIAVAPNSPSIAAQNTFDNPILEIGKGMNNLTPDVQLLFQRFGLQTSNVAEIATSTSRPTINTNSYTNFKPLPTSNIKDQDMKEFLAKFGLGTNDNRKQKAMLISTERPSLIEAVPDNMRHILENIGLISRKVPKTTSKMENRKPTETSKFHVFKPHEVQIKDEGQKMKINELLDTIKLVQEGKASAKDVRKVADDLLITTKSLKDGPDPLSLEEIIRIYNEDVKNEVKRQQNPEEVTENTTSDVRGSLSTSATPTTTESLDISSTTTSTTMTTTVISTTSDSAKDGSSLQNSLTLEPSTSTTANLVALEESFGGTTPAPNPVLPTKRRNGLYFLVDWNTFLEVGEDDKEKVNLRFQPKVGDRTRFLPVSIP